jgi:hypothetical protein
MNRPDCLPDWLVFTNRHRRMVLRDYKPFQFWHNDTLDSWEESEERHMDEEMGA